MHKTVLFAVAALGAAVAIGSQVDAQPAPPPPPGMEGPGPGPRGPMMGGMRRGPMDGREQGRGGHMRGMMQRMRAFGLVYPAPDRNLSGPDVQKIAEAFLLFNGNHTWKITEVTEEPARVTFAIATPEGTAIAHFAMDRHTARPERLN